MNARIHFKNVVIIRLLCAADKDQPRNCSIKFNATVLWLIFRGKWKIPSSHSWTLNMAFYLILFAIPYVSHINSKHPLEKKHWISFGGFLSTTCITHTEQVRTRTLHVLKFLKFSWKFLMSPYWTLSRKFISSNIFTAYKMRLIYLNIIKFVQEYSTLMFAHSVVWIKGSKLDIFNACLLSWTTELGELKSR